MPSYRYYTADLLTGDVLGDFDMYGVYAQKLLNTAGNFNGSIKLIPGLVDMAVEASEPGRTALYMERNDDLIWGGIIWSRTYSSESNALQLTAQTFESYFDHVVFEEHFIQQKVNQELIFQAMVNQLQAQTASNIGLTMATLPTTNVPRTVLIPAYEYHFATDALTQLVGVSNGLDYTIDVAKSATPDHPTKTVRLGYPQLGSANDELHFDFPGNIRNYWMPESGANSGTKFGALGAGSGNKIIRAVAVDSNALADGYPGWWVVNQYSHIGDIATIQDRVLKDATLYKTPRRVPTFELRIAETPFTSWNKLGDTATIRIEDMRYPTGFEMESRIIGWELTPQSSENVEMLKFDLEGAE